MRKELICILGAWILAASPLRAQILPIPPAPRDSFDAGNPANVNARVHAIYEPLQGYNQDVFRFWARCEYVLGMVRKAPQPIPLVTTGDPKDKQPGAIGQTNTQVQLGNAGAWKPAAGCLSLALPVVTSGIGSGAFRTMPSTYSQRAQNWNASGL